MINENGLFFSKSELTEKFKESFDINKPVIAYWGGGICATINLFLMEYAQIPAAQNGKASLYDDSLSGWVTNESNPMVFTTGNSKL